MISPNELGWFAATTTLTMLGQLGYTVRYEQRALVMRDGASEDRSEHVRGLWNVQMDSYKRVTASWTRRSVTGMLGSDFTPKLSIPTGQPATASTV